MLMVDKPSRGWQRPWVVGVYSAALADSLYSLWRYAVRGVGGGAFLGLPRMSPAFADLRQLTHSAGCSASAQALLANAANCDPFGRPFNYTPFSLAILRALHLTAASTPALGAILGASSLLLVSVFFLTATESKDRALVAAAICFMGFPFQLALERGNYDLVAFELCLALCALSLRDDKAARSGAAACAFLVSALKLFPAAGILLWSFASAHRGRRLVELFVPAALGVISQAQYLPHILHNTPHPDGKSISFGLLAAYQERVGFAASALLVCFKLLVGAAAFVLARRQLNCVPAEVRHDFFAQNTLDALAFAAFGSLSVAVYFVGRSFDYRLLFLLGMIPLLLNWLSRCDTRQRRTLPLSLVVLIAAISFEQYTPDKIGKAIHLATDMMLQPLFFGASIAILVTLILPHAHATPTTAAPT